MPLIMRLVGGAVASVGLLQLTIFGGWKCSCICCSGVCMSWYSSLSYHPYLHIPRLDALDLNPYQVVSVFVVIGRRSLVSLVFYCKIVVELPAVRYKDFRERVTRDKNKTGNEYMTCIHSLHTLHRCKLLGRGCHVIM